MNIADRIKRLRELFGITSNEFAKITGIHPVSIRKYETNKMVPGIDIIDKMCDALKLPRMIFEGFTKQHTDYHFAGDFYQQLFLLLDNKTLFASKKDNTGSKISANYKFLTFNPLLAKYIKINHGDKEIPLDEINIEIRTDEDSYLKTTYYYFMYMEHLELAQMAAQNESWDDESEPKEEYISRMLKLAEIERFDLMLIDHSWEQYMTGWGPHEVLSKAIEQEILDGGDFYTYIEKKDVPEAERNRFIHYYEDAYIEIMIQMDEEYPHDKGWVEKMAWSQKKVALIEQYKIDHPNYPELARKFAAEEARRIRSQI